MTISLMFSRSGADQTKEDQKNNWRKEKVERERQKYKKRGGAIQTQHKRCFSGGIPFIFAKTSKACQREGLGEVRWPEDLSLNLQAKK